MLWAALKQKRTCSLLRVPNPRNSLRAPNVEQPTSKLSVQVDALDTCLAEKKIERVDFVKMDVEGAEIEVLKGAIRLLENRP